MLVSKSKKPQLKIDFKLPVTIMKEGDVFVAYTPSLDVSTSGKDIEQVQRRFIELVGIYFEELLDMGTLDEVLLDLGWSKNNSDWQPPMPVMHNLQQVTVPLSC